MLMEERGKILDQKVDFLADRYEIWYKKQNRLVRFISFLASHAIFITLAVISMLYFALTTLPVLPVIVLMLPIDFTTKFIVLIPSMYIGYAWIDHFFTEYENSLE